METGGGPTLQFLLCLAWLAFIIPIAGAIALPIPAAAGGRIVRRMLFTIASRGKIFRGSSSKAGLTIPKRFFLHFYVLGVAVTTSLLLVTWFYAYMKMSPLVLESSSYSTIASHHVGGSNSFSWANASPMEQKHRVWRTVFVLILMEIQVLRRMYETKHVFHYSPRARMHPVTYLVGSSYYVIAPLTLAGPCLPEAMQYLRCEIAEFIVKGRARMLDLVIELLHIVKPLLMLGWCEWIGAAIFFWGYLHQFRCHAILGSLREHKDSGEYVIPCGDWFSHVSCPHYLAEIVIYFGLFIASGGSYIPLWFLLFFVIMNLSFSAVQTHEWYLQKFEDYPRSRYALIPYIC